jgi:hypothetical protein
MKVAHINTNGLNQIQKALGQYHKLGVDHFTDTMLMAWAAEAEDHFDNGNGCYFEIKSWDSVRGRPEVVEIDEGGYDVETINDE